MQASPLLHLASAGTGSIGLPARCAGLGHQPVEPRSSEIEHRVGLLAAQHAFRRKIRRLGPKEAFEKLPPCIVGMEACLSAHFVSRVLRGLGHEPRIIPAIYTKPFVKGQKNDYHDAEAIAEAALRPNLHVVQEKSQNQLDLQACHRVRSRLVSRRTATINQIRAFGEPKERDLAAND
jgi:transposase